MTSFPNQTEPQQASSQEGWIKKYTKIALKKLLEKIIFILFKFPFIFLWEAFITILIRFGPLVAVLLFYKNVAPWIVKNWGDKLHPFLKWILTIFPALLLTVTLTGCGTSHQKPADIGMGTDDLKMSECEPCKMTPFYKDGQWLIERK